MATNATRPEVLFGSRGLRLANRDAHPIGSCPNLHSPHACPRGNPAPPASSGSRDRGHNGASSTRSRSDIPDQLSAFRRPDFGESSQFRESTLDSNAKRTQTRFVQSFRISFSPVDSALIILPRHGNAIASMVAVVVPLRVLTSTNRTDPMFRQPYRVIPIELRTVRFRCSHPRAGRDSGGKRQTCWIPSCEGMTFGEAWRIGIS